MESRNVSDTRRPLQPHEQACLMFVLAVFLILWGGRQSANWLCGRQLVERVEMTRCDYRLVVPINRADAAELCLLPRIGPKLAERVIRSRQIDGPFRSPVDLQRVHGIGPITAKRLAPMISFEP